MSNSEVVVCRLSSRRNQAFRPSTTIPSGPHGNAGEIGRLFAGIAPRPSGIDLLAELKATGADTHLIGGGCACYAAFALHPGHAALVGAYFLIWWSGATAAEASLARRYGFAAIAPPLAWLAARSILAGAIVTIEGARGAGVYPVLPLRHFAVAALLLAVLQ